MTDILRRIENASELSRIAFEVKEENPKLSKVLRTTVMIELSEFNVTDEMGCKVDKVGELKP